jgi:ribonucleoside-diphosphate reductase alpha chain
MAFDWLNEHSQLFLERGYLLPGVSTQDRVRQIADAAEKILKKE